MNERKQAQWLLKLSTHEVTGKGYEIFTDIKDPKYLELLEKLADHHKGKLTKVENFKTLKTTAKFVAIAPKTLSIDIVLGCWKSLSQLDDDPELDAYPGFLAAPDFESFKKLINNSISYKPIKTPKLGIIANYGRETRSYEKAVMIKNEFPKRTNALITVSSNRKVTEPDFLSQPSTLHSPARTIKNPKHLEEADILLTFGHGKSDKLCGFTVKAFDKINITNKAVFSGSCHSGDQFALAAVKQGAVFVYSHLELNSGFPALYPSLSHLLDGKPAGQIQQELINAQKLFQKNAPKRPNRPSRFQSRFNRNRPKRHPENHLLYIIIADPALCYQ